MSMSYFVYARRPLPSPAPLIASVLPDGPAWVGEADSWNGTLGALSLNEVGLRPSPEPPFEAAAIRAVVEVNGRASAAWDPFLEQVLPELLRVTDGACVDEEGSSHPREPAQSPPDALGPLRACVDEGLLPPSALAMSSVTWPVPVRSEREIRLDVPALLVRVARGEARAAETLHDDLFGHDLFRRSVVGEASLTLLPVLCDLLALPGHSVELTRPLMRAVTECASHAAVASAAIEVIRSRDSWIERALQEPARFSDAFNVARLVWARDRLRGVLEALVRRLPVSMELVPVALALRETGFLQPATASHLVEVLDRAQDRRISTSAALALHASADRVESAVHPQIDAAITMDRLADLSPWGVVMAPLRPLALPPPAPAGQFERVVAAEVWSVQSDVLVLVAAGVGSWRVDPKGIAAVPGDRVWVRDDGTRREVHWKKNFLTQVSKFDAAWKSIA